MWRLRAFAMRSRILPVWVATGVLFHLGLALFLLLGIFPWGCLALYPALAHPDTLRAFYVRCRDWFANWRKPKPAPITDAAPAPNSVERA